MEGRRYRLVYYWFVLVVIKFFDAQVHVLERSFWVLFHRLVLGNLIFEILSVLGCQHVVHLFSFPADGRCQRSTKVSLLSESRVDTLLAAKRGLKEKKGDRSLAEMFFGT